MGIILARSILTAIILFEFLNLIGVFYFEIDFTWFGLLFTALVVWTILESVHFLIKKHLGKGLPAWVFLLATFSLALDAFGDIFGWYGMFLKYDTITHFVGGATVAAILGYVILRLEAAEKIALGMGNIFFILTVMAFAMAFGSIYEIEEYLEDYFRGSNRLGDGPDTANDMLLNTFGAFVSASIITYKRRVILSKTKVKNL